MEIDLKNLFPLKKQMNLWLQILQFLCLYLELEVEKEVEAEKTIRLIIMPCWTDWKEILQWIGYLLVCVFSKFNISNVSFQKEK